MDKSTHGVHLSEPLQTNDKQPRIAVKFLTVYNVTFEITNRIKTVCFTLSINEDDINVISIPPGAYELESLDDEFKRNIIKEGYFTQEY